MTSGWVTTTAMTFYVGNDFQLGKVGLDSYFTFLVDHFAGRGEISPL